ncbi:hypothetical protein T11_5903, partial [Trichinella zimbabwensis]
LVNAQMWVNDANGGHYGRSIPWAQKYGMTWLCAESTKISQQTPRESCSC